MSAAPTACALCHCAGVAGAVKELEHPAAEKTTQLQRRNTLRVCDLPAIIAAGLARKLLGWVGSAEILCEQQAVG